MPSSCYYSGFTVLAKRSEWCNSKYTTSPCAGKLLARFGGHVKREFMEWRCYCPVSLLKAKYTYDFDTNSQNFHTSHQNLVAIN